MKKYLFLLTFALLGYDGYSQLKFTGLSVNQVEAELSTDTGIVFHEKAINSKGVPYLVYNVTDDTGYKRMYFFNGKNNSFASYLIVFKTKFLVDVIHSMGEAFDKQDGGFWLSKDKQVKAVFDMPSGQEFFAITFSNIADQ